jgi:hypothetical protein
MALMIIKEKGYQLVILLALRWHLFNAARQPPYITLIKLRQDDQIAKITSWREYDKNNTPKCLKESERLIEIKAPSLIKSHTSCAQHYNANSVIFT